MMTTPTDSLAATAPLRLGIAGITGRLGHLCAQEAEESAQKSGGLTLTGGLCRHPDKLGQTGLFHTADPRALAARCDVVIDVTHASQVRPHADAFVQAGVAWVVGTTGLDSDAQQAIAQAAQHIPVLQAANFSPALTVFLSLARQLGASLPGYDAEILDLHHRQKQDAPSGTALAIGRAVAEGRGEDFSAVCRLDQNGPRPDGAIGFAALRGGQVIGEHELKFLAEDEEITLSHRALDRRIFARGALKAAEWLGRPGRMPGLYSMEDALRQP